MLTLPIVYLLVIYMSIPSGDDIPDTPHCYQSDSDFYGDEQSSLDVQDVIRSSPGSFDIGVRTPSGSIGPLVDYDDSGKSIFRLLSYDL